MSNTLKKYKEIANTLVYLDRRAEAMTHFEDPDMNFIVSVIQYWYETGEYFGKEDTVGLFLDLRDDSLEYWESRIQKQSYDLVETWKKYEDNPVFRELLTKINVE